MADNEDKGQGSANVFRTIFKVDKDKSVDIVLNAIERRLGKIPEERKLRITGDFNNRISPKLENAFKDWDKILRRKTSGLFRNAFGDKTQIRNTEQFFTKLKLTAMNAMDEYQAELDRLEGVNRDLGDDSEIGKVNKAYALQVDELNNATAALTRLQQQRDNMAKEHAKLSLLPSQQDILKEQNILQANLERISRQLEKSVTFKSSDAIAGMDQKAKIIMERSNDLAKHAVAAYMRTGDKSYYETLIADLNATSQKYADAKQAITMQIGDLRTQEEEANTRLEEALRIMTEDPTTEHRQIAQDMEAEVEKLQDKIRDLANEQIRMDLYIDLNTKRMTDTVKEWENQMNNEIHLNPKAKTEGIIGEIGHKQRMTTKAEDVYSNYVGRLTNETYIKELEDRRDALIDIKHSMEAEFQKAGETDTARFASKQEQEKINEEIKAQKKYIRETEQEVAILVKLMEKLGIQSAEVTAEIERLMNDLKGNPLQNMLASDALQPLNRDADKLNSKWKTMNALTKLGHKVLVNMYSQIASFISPLNIFKRAWAAWMSEYDSKVWSNTFEVVAFNLVQVIKPALEWVAKMVLKIVAVLNVFTKRFAGIDLFDKSAWQLDKIKKGVGQLTAGFDELHSTTDNENMFNTVFDKGLIDEDALLTDNWKKKLEDFADWVAPWADKLGKVIKWAVENPLAALGIYLGAKLLGPAILGGIGKLIGKGLSKLFGGGEAAAGAKAGGSFLGKLFGKELYTGMGGKAVTVGKLLGGIALTAGGTYLAISQAADAGKNWQDLTDSQKAAKIGMVGIGSAAAGVGAVLLGASGPIGWAVGLGVLAVSAVVGMSQVQDGIKSVKKETKEWEKAAEAMEEALIVQEQASSNYSDSLIVLKDLEQSTGESGEYLARMVDEGKISLEGMTSNQIKVYNAYKDSKKALKELTEATKQANEAVRTEAKEASDVLIANGRKSKSYDELADHINTCWQDGTMSTETAKDQIERAMAGMSASARTEFLDKLKPALQEGLDYEQYQSGWNKFGRFWEEMWTNAVGVHDGSIANMKASEEDLLATTDRLREAQEGLLEAQNNLTEAEKLAGMTIEELNAKIDAGEIAVYELTDAQRALYDAHLEVENSSALVDQAMKKNGENIAGLAKQAYQSTGDWKVYIDKLVKANKDGQISTADMEKEIGISLGEMNRETQNSAREYLGSINQMTNGVEQACREQEGFFSNMFKNIGNWIDNAKRNWSAWWADVLPGGKTSADFKISSSGIPSYDVGTNYVPNDQLAVVHRGEAIIPKKYNTGSVPGGDNGVADAIYGLQYEMQNLRSTLDAGIPVTGEFKQRGSDLVATVEKAKSSRGNNPISNPAYAR